MKKESWTLLWVWTVYLPVKEIKWEFYVKVSDFTRCMDSMRNELEEENKNLNKQIEQFKKWVKAWTKIIERLEEENKKLNIKVASLEWEIKWLNSTIEKLHKELEECECSFWFENDEVWYRKRECKKLKEKVETLELWLDNKEKLNEGYRKQIDKYKRQYEHSMWFMEEDTLQELKDIWELEDDELIYEEWLYD